MMECFIAYKKQDSIEELTDTLEGWEKVGVEPIAIECETKKFELVRRVTAENISHGDYILADMGCVPVEFGFGEIAEKALSEHPEVGLIGAWRQGQTKNEFPNGVVVCRKGIVEKWPTAQSQFYIQEHVKAYELAGMKSLLCHQIHYRRASKSLPC